jgi:AraC-like DNA-binding protein
MRASGYSTQKAAPCLGGLIDYFWTLNDAPAHAKECVLPNGTIELVFNLHEDEFRIHHPTRSGAEPARFRGGIVSGTYAGAFVVETRAHASIIGVHFQPGGAAAFLGVPAGALSDAHVELEALWGRRALELRERLCAAESPAERLRFLQQSLIERLSRSPDVYAHSPGVRGEVAFALDRLGAPGVAVGDVAEQVELSHRRFIELFTEQIGMTPKRYAMVRRFRRALHSAMNRAALGPPPWAEIALDCGYFDQAHLCHDWVKFTGLSPVEFLRGRNVPVKEHHVALPASSG